MGKNNTTDHVNEVMASDVSEAVQTATAQDLENAFPIRDTLRYIKNDTYVDVTKVLGSVFYERKGSNQLQKHIIPLALPIDDSHTLPAPQTVSELVIDSKTDFKANALKFVTANLSTEELLEIRVINNAAARVNDRDASWENAIMDWMSKPLPQKLIEDQNVGRISIVTGVVQKYFTTKKYRKFSVGAKGGGWGINVDGKLYTSTSQFELSVIYGLDLVTLKPAFDTNEFAESLAQRNFTTEKSDIIEMGEMFENMKFFLDQIA